MTDADMERKHLWLRRFQAVLFLGALILVIGVVVLCILKAAEII